MGRALASSLLLPLWIASLFSRHFICSGILSQLKTSEAYISSNPDVPASWSAPRHSWENILSPADLSSPPESLCGPHCCCTQRRGPSESGLVPPLGMCK